MLFVLLFVEYKNTDLLSMGLQGLSQPKFAKLMHFYHNFYVNVLYLYLISWEHRYSLNAEKIIWQMHKHLVTV